MDLKRTRFPWLYLILAYALAWVFWIPIAISRQDYTSSPVLLIAFLMGVFGPGIAGIVITYVETGRNGGKDFWHRAVDARRVRPLWWLAILILWPLLHLAAIALTRLLGGASPSWTFVREMAGQPLNLAIVSVLYLLQAGLEELGWRGYMLDRLLARFSPLGASLRVGICHTLWHLPLFWMAGTNQIEWGFGPDFWLFVGLSLAMSIVGTWCYNGNRRSTFAVTALHFTYNLSLDILSSPGMQQRIFQAILILGILIATLLRHRKQWSRGVPRSSKERAVTLVEINRVRQHAKEIR